MSEWKEYKIKDIANRIISGGTPSTKNRDYYDGNIPWLNTKEIRFNRIFDTDVKITETGLNNSSAKWVEKNSVMVAMYGATSGKTAINKIPLTTNQACCNITVNQDVADYSYIYYSLFNSYAELVNLASGAAQQNLNVGIISNFPISLPPLPEQRTIAGVLSSLDDKIDLLHRQNKTLEDMTKTLFRKWFIEEAETDAFVSLGNYADNIRYNVKIDELSNFENYIGLEHIPKKSITITKWGKTKGIESNKTAFIQDDILFGKLRSYFHKVIFTPVDGVCSTDILVIRPKKKEWFAFCLFWFSSKDVVEHSDLGSGGTRMPRTNWKIISEYKIPKPNPTRIMEFNEITSPLIEKISYNVLQIHLSETLRDLLLPKIINGDIRLSMEET